MIFQPVGTGFTVDTATSIVIAEALVGGGLDNGAGFPTTGTTDISGHYGFRDDVALAGLGSHILSSVGDVTFSVTAPFSVSDFDLVAQWPVFDTGATCGVFSLSNALTVKFRR